MKKFIIYASESWLWINRQTKGLFASPKKCCLQHDTMAFYHSEYYGGGAWKIKGTIENIICTFKNDITRYSQDILDSCVSKLSIILQDDLPRVKTELGCQSLRVCVVPRSKRESYYKDDQKLFRDTIQTTISELDGFEDGTYDIIRHTDTLTTHLAWSGNGGNGPKPYPGITSETCSISDQIEGKDILLIDDLYTKTVGIDEDAIQALYDNGAKKVYFYSVGRTVYPKKKFGE